MRGGRREKKGNRNRRREQGKMDREAESTQSPPADKYDENGLTKAFNIPKLHWSCFKLKDSKDIQGLRASRNGARLKLWKLGLCQPTLQLLGKWLALGTSKSCPILASAFLAACFFPTQTDICR